MPGAFWYYNSLLSYKLLFFWLNRINRLSEIKKSVKQEYQPSRFSMSSTLFKARFKYCSFFNLLTFSEKRQRDHYFNRNHPNKTTWEVNLLHSCLTVTSNIKHEQKENICTFINKYYFLDNGYTDLLKETVWKRQEP